MDEKAKPKTGFECPHCGKLIRRLISNREFGGQVSTCPWCKEPIDPDQIPDMKQD